jgi:hypothetical protein
MTWVARPDGARHRRRPRSAAGAGLADDPRGAPADEPALEVEPICDEVQLRQNLGDARVELATHGAQQRRRSNRAQASIWLKVGQAAGRKCDSDSERNTV